MMDDVFTIFEDLPTTLRSFVRENADLSYTIVCNSRLTEEAQREAILHEYRHIARGDLKSLAGVDQIEAEAHRDDKHWSLPTMGLDKFT